MGCGASCVRSQEKFRGCLCVQAQWWGARICVAWGDQSAFVMICVDVKKTYAYTYGQHQPASRSALKKARRMAALTATQQQAGSGDRGSPGGTGGGTPSPRAKRRRGADVEEARRSSPVPETGVRTSAGGVATKRGGRSDGRTFEEHVGVGARRSPPVPTGGRTSAGGGTTKWGERDGRTFAEAASPTSPEHAGARRSPPVSTGGRTSAGGGTTKWGERDGRTFAEVASPTSPGRGASGRVEEQSSTPSRLPEPAQRRTTSEGALGTGPLKVPVELEELSSELERNTRFRVEDWVRRADFALRRLGVDADSDKALITILTRVKPDSTAWRLYIAHEGRKEGQSWQAFRALLKVRLGGSRIGVEARVHRLESTKLESAATFLDFADAFRNAVEEAPPRADADITVTLLRALPEELATYVRERGGTALWSDSASWPRAMQIAQEFFESRQPDALYDRTAHQRWLRESIAAHRWKQVPTRKVNPAAGRQMGGSRESATRATSQTGGEPMYPYPRRCYVCQRYGHISTDCPERSDDRSNRRAGERQRGNGTGGAPPGGPYRGDGSTSASVVGPNGRENHGSGKEQWQGPPGKPWGNAMPRGTGSTGTMSGPVGREGNGPGRSQWQGASGEKKVGVLVVTERSEAGKSSKHDRPYREREEEKRHWQPEATQWERPDDGAMESDRGWNQEWDQVEEDRNGVRHDYGQDNYSGERSFGSGDEHPPSELETSYVAGAGDVERLLWTQGAVVAQASGTRIPVRCILDCGATRTCVVSEAMAERLHLTNVCRTVRLVTAGDTQGPQRKAIVGPAGSEKLGLWMMGVWWPLRQVVVLGSECGLDADIVLGLDFLREMEATIDFGTKAVKFASFPDQWHRLLTAEEAGMVAMQTPEKGGEELEAGAVCREWEMETCPAPNRESLFLMGLAQDMLLRVNEERQRMEGKAATVDPFFRRVVKTTEPPRDLVRDLAQVWRGSTGLVEGGSKPGEEAAAEEDFDPPRAPWGKDEWTDEEWTSAVKRATEGAGDGPGDEAMVRMLLEEFREIFPKEIDVSRPLRVVLKGDMVKEEEE